MYLPLEWKQKLESKKITGYIKIISRSLQDNEYKVIAYAKHENWDAVILINKRGTLFLSNGTSLWYLCSMHGLNNFKLVSKTEVNLDSIERHWLRWQEGKFIR